MTYTKYLCLVALSAILALSCGDKTDPLAAIPPDDNTPGNGTTVSYAADIQPIVELYCTGCHSSQLSGAQRNGAPLSVNFDSYEAASASAGRANARIQAGSMPPGGSVPSADRTVFQLWVSEGIPQ